MRVNARDVEQFAEPFRRDMTRLGWEEGKGYRTQFLWADGDGGRLIEQGATTALLDAPRDALTEAFVKGRVG